MNILLLGWYYSSNLGDAVICDCVARELEADFPGSHVEIRDMAGRTAFPARGDVTMDQLLRQRRRHRLRVAATRLGWDRQAAHQQWCLRQDQPRMAGVTEGDWDLVVFAGGQLFMDDLILYVCHYGKELARRGIPVIFNACGTGLSCSPALRKQLAEALNLPNVVAVTCRDDVDLVNRWCGPGRAEPTDDPALWADQVYGVSRQTGSGVVGLGVMFPMSLDPRQTIRFWRKTVAALDRAGIPWKMFTNGSQRDMAFAGEIGSTDLLCPPPQSPRELVELVASFDAIVSFRLHSHVLAASLDVPSVAVAWDRKLPAFFEKTGHPERCLTIHASPEQVLLVLEQARQQGYDRQDLLHRREQARRNLNGQVREALSRNQKGAK